MKTLKVILFGSALTLIVTCSEAVVDPGVVLYDLEFEPEDWTTETHGKSANPNFEEVFDNTAVKRLDIVVTEENWQAMLDDMTDLYGSFGSGSGGGPGGGLNEGSEDPIFVPADIFYNDIQWYRVGVRFKGNSSLQSSWGNGILKLSLKLDFDEFEDEVDLLELKKLNIVYATIVPYKNEIRNQEITILRDRLYTMIEEKSYE